MWVGEITVDASVKENGNASITMIVDAGPSFARNPVLSRDLLCSVREADADVRNSLGITATVKTKH